MDYNSGNMGMGSAPSMSTPNPYAYPSETCENCGNDVFVPGVIFKKVPGVLMGVGTETVPIPIKVAVCSKCGTLSPLDRERLEEEEKIAKQAEEAKKKSSLII